MRLSASLAPTTAGISRARAMIDVWLVRVPISVTKPTTGSSTMAEVSAGERSWATTISGPSSSGGDWRFVRRAREGACPR